MISINYLLIIYIFCIYTIQALGETEFCSSETTQICESKYSQKANEEYVGSVEKTSKRYLIYDQNLGEGFNLRRDVYIRMALLAHQLGPEWVLVLPKWSLLPHWRRRPQTSDDSMTQWKTYFDLKSLNQFVSVIEFNDFVQHFQRSDNQNEVTIDVVLALDHFEDTFETNDWFERHSLKDCNETKYYRRIGHKIVNSYEKNNRLNYKRLVCLRIEGFISTLRQIIANEFFDSKTIFISNAEIIVNNEFGSKNYWSVRRSMRFSKPLISIANQFRHQFLNSDDISDKTAVDSDWQSMTRSHGQAIGGPYLSVHLRRSDFAKWRPKDVPNIECALKQIEFALNTFVKSNSVFIASDADLKEWNLIEKSLNEKNIQLFRFKSDELSDGQKAIVEQWIALHGMLFMGTYDSTFSFRIQEEREILGFNPNTTFNAFCSKCENRLKLCSQESKWKIVY